MPVAMSGHIKGKAARLYSRDLLRCAAAGISGDQAAAAELPLQRLQVMPVGTDSWQ